MYFLAWGMVMSIAALGVAGLIGVRHFVMALSVLPFVVSALWVAQPLAHRAAKARIRPVALGLAGCAATVLLLKQVI